MAEKVSDDPNRVVDVIAGWGNSFRHLFGGQPLPTSYVTYDLETSGFDRADDLILEYGHCAVRDGKVIDRRNVILNWYDSPVVSPAWLDTRLARVARHMQLDGRSWHLPPERLKREGKPPQQVLEAIYNFISSRQAAGIIFVTLNGWNFDNQMLVSHFEQDLRKTFAFRPDQMLDVGCIEKASQMDLSEARPLPGETLSVYLKRINYAHVTGAKWNIEHCIKKHALEQEHGELLTATHSAGHDSYVLYLLMEKFRQILNAVSPTATVMPATCLPSGSRVPPTPGPVYRGQRNY